MLFFKLLQYTVVSLVPVIVKSFRFFRTMQRKYFFVSRKWMLPRNVTFGKDKKKSLEEKKEGA